eukprot:GDKJ01049630.1.p1 GENE.GDKJ01049630.1~~GDKJ01049630.1.p1  ORF type:complete len:697 (+),score=110.17 GDKJ01049630.1:47-2137(+)
MLLNADILLKIVEYLTIDDAISIVPLKIALLINIPNSRVLECVDRFLVHVQSDRSNFLYHGLFLCQKYRIEHLDEINHLEPHSHLSVLFSGDADHIIERYATLSPTLFNVACIFSSNTTHFQHLAAYYTFNNPNDFQILVGFYLLGKKEKIDISNFVYETYDWDLSPLMASLHDKLRNTFPSSLALKRQEYKLNFLDMIHRFYFHNSKPHLLLQHICEHSFCNTECINEPEIVNVFYECLIEVYGIEKCLDLFERSLFLKAIEREDFVALNFWVLEWKKHKNSRRLTITCEENEETFGDLIAQLEDPIRMSQWLLAQHEDRCILCLTSLQLALVVVASLQEDRLRDDEYRILRDAEMKHLHDFRSLLLFFRGDGMQPLRVLTILLESHLFSEFILRDAAISLFGRVEFKMPSPAHSSSGIRSRRSSRSSLIVAYFDLIASSIQIENLFESRGIVTYQFFQIKCIFARVHFTDSWLREAPDFQPLIMQQVRRVFALFPDPFNSVDDCSSLYRTFTDVNRLVLACLHPRFLDWWKAKVALQVHKLNSHGFETNVVRIQNQSPFTSVSLSCQTIVLLVSNRIWNLTDCWKKNFLSAIQHGFFCSENDSVAFKMLRRAFTFFDKVMEVNPQMPSSEILDQFLPLQFMSALQLQFFIPLLIDYGFTKIYVTLAEHEFFDSKQNSRFIQLYSEKGVIFANLN